MAVGLVAVSSALYLSRVPARSFTPEVRLWCAAYTAFLLTLSLARVSVVTRATRRNREIGFFLPPTLGQRTAKSRPSAPRKNLCSLKRPRRAAPRRATPRRTVCVVTNFDLDSPEDRGEEARNSEARETEHRLWPLVSRARPRALEMAFLHARERPSALPLSRY
jgi:hypothetical protein